MAGRGLLLDLDGTLADSLTALKGVYYAFLAEFGASGSEAEFHQLNGPPLASVVEQLRITHSLPGEPPDLLRKYTALLREAHATSRPAAGAHELLQHVRTRGWKVAVVTSSPRSAVLKWLEHVGLADAVDVVVGGDEVTPGKPAADPYVLALSRMSCSAARSHAVEDSRAGAISAVGAGLNTWALAAPDNPSDWPSGVTFVGGLAELIERLPTC